MYGIFNIFEYIIAYIHTYIHTHTYITIHAHYSWDIINLITFKQIQNHENYFTVAKQNRKTIDYSVLYYNLLYSNRLNVRIVFQFI